jgi:hypothetical protein
MPVQSLPGCCLPPCWPLLCARRTSSTMIGSFMPLLGLAAANPTAASEFCLVRELVMCSTPGVRGSVCARSKHYSHRVQGSSHTSIHQLTPCTFLRRQVDHERTSLVSYCAEIQNLPGRRGSKGALHGPHVRHPSSELLGEDTSASTRPRRQVCCLTCQSINLPHILHFRM